MRNVLPSLPLILTLVTVLIGGCGPTPSPVPPAVDQNKASETLIVVMDAWKAGQKPDDLRKHKPEIFVKDLDWEAGAKLVDYKITENKKPRDAILIEEVQLTLEMPDGKTSKKTAKFQIGTNKTLTVLHQYVPD